MTCPRCLYLRATDAQWAKEHACAGSDCWCHGVCWGSNCTPWWGDARAMEALAPLIQAVREADARCDALLARDRGASDSEIRVARVCEEAARRHLADAIIARFCP